MDKSVVIIGGGLGGLFTGAILAKEGCKVTVLEKNATVGGGLQSFKRFGEVFDTGMHVIGGMQPGGNIRRICEYLGIMDRVHVVHVDPQCTDLLNFAEDNSCYRMVQGREAYVENLSRMFPDEAESIRNYVDALYAIVDSLDMFHLRPQSEFFTMPYGDMVMPASDFVAKYISDRRLRGVVSYMNPLYGGVEGETPAYIHAIVSVLYINGASRFEGGSQQFADTLADFIRENGGTVVAADPVEHIHSEDRMITGVTTKKGRSYSADYYISAIHPCALLPLFDDPKALPKPYRTRLDEIPNSYSAFTVNIKFKPNSFRYFNSAGYFMARYDDVWRFGYDDAQWPLGFLYITPPDPDQGEYATHMIVTAPMKWCQCARFADTTYGHRSEEYKQWKAECADKLLDYMEGIYPGFRECISDINTASPVTVRDFYNAKEGTMCGYSKDANNMALSQLPVVTKIPNLLLTGQNNNLHGFCGVPLTAIQTAEVILGHNYVLNRINGVE